VGAAEILIGIPTYNHADTIAPLVRAAQLSLAQFPDRVGVIVQADGGSTDGTLGRALHAANGSGSLLQVSYPLHPVHKLAEYQSLPGRESAYHTIFSVAREMGAMACCLIEPDGQAIGTSWISSLMQPIVDAGFDLVTPQYHRHKYDGLLITGVLYPMVRALFGKRIRQPIGSDFGFSSAMMASCLSGSERITESARHQIDLWISLQALQNDLAICQVSLGGRPRAKKGVAPELSTLLADAVGTLFTEIERSAQVWQRVRGSQATPTFGLRLDVDTAPANVDLNPMVSGFRIGCENLQDIWSRVLPPATLIELRKLSRVPEANFRLPAELWARVLYDFAVGYRLRTIGHDHLLRALTPLYLGWAASFIASIKNARPREVEEQIEQLGSAFEAEKPYLISRWRWPDRFTP
jgi:hypothetical protein